MWECTLYSLEVRAVFIKYFSAVCTIYASHVTLHTNGDCSMQYRYQPPRHMAVLQFYKKGLGVLLRDTLTRPVQFIQWDRTFT